MRGSYWTFIPLVLLWVVPIIVFVIVTPVVADEEKAAFRASAPDSVVVGSRENDYRQAVSVVFQVTEQQDLLTQAAGLVVEVHVAPGQAISNADPLFTVDTVVVRAHVSAAPFYREIGPEASGTDVVRLAEYLASNGLPVDLEGKADYNSDLAEAIRKYQSANGVVPDGVFRPEVVVFVPEGELTVQTVLASVGAAVSPGEAVLTGPALPLSLDILGDTPLKLAGKEGPFAIDLGSQDLILSSLEPGLEEVLTIYSALQEASERGDSELVDEEGIQTFSGVLLHLPSPIKVGTLPSSAVYTSVNGSSCVFQVPGGSSDLTAVDNVAASVLTDPVPVDGEIGLVSVPRDYVGTTVIRNPRSLDREVLESCQ